MVDHCGDDDGDYFCLCCGVVAVMAVVMVAVVLVVVHVGAAVVVT